MTTNTYSRRSALKWMLAGSAVTLGTGCAALESLPRGSSGGTTDGSALAIKVQQALRNNPSTARFAVNIESEEDEVIIKGHVPARGDIDTIELVANEVDGVRHAIIDLYVR